MIKIESRTTVRIFTTILLIIAIVLVFNVYINMNSERISQQNASYIKSSAIETANRLVDILGNARSGISNSARLYGKTLAGREIDPEDLKSMTDRTMFDYIEFVNADGVGVNAQGERTDRSDRSYFISGMQGKSGMDVTHTSRFIDERPVVFYAPVKYQGEIIGVLTGHYREERMRDILETFLFDELAPSFLCLEDGTIITSIGMEVGGDSFIDFVEERVSAEERSGIVRALAEEGQYAFSYETDQGATMAYMVSLPGNRWTIIQFFPVDALNEMQKNANAAGMLLEMELIALFGLYVVVLLVQAWRRQKGLLKGKQEAERIVKGINNLFTRFVLVKLDEDIYRYMNGQKPSFKGLAPQGKYSDFVKFFEGKFTTGYDMTPMEEVITKEYIVENFPESVPFERYEYQVLRGQEKVWESMALIVLERKDGRPVSVLLAIQEITGHKQKELRTQDALKEAYQAAEAANNAKSEFLSRMSHDIRTPMNAIMGMTAIAAMHMDDRARVEDCLSKISISSRHLLGLINEVLDMSKIESGKLELVDEEFDLAEAVEGLLGIFQPQIEGKRQELSVTLSGVTHERVVGDSQRLSQVLVNIMGNAIKFTPEGGNISLHINEKPSRAAEIGCYEFIVTDTGIGMDEEFVAKMFEPFARAGDSRTGKIEGTGLGMPIAKSIVSMMNGSIKVKSKKGEGTQIMVTVFLRYVPDAEEELSMLAGNRVMVVDDEQTACENACNILSSINMPAVWFTDGDEAVEELVRDQQNEDSYVAVILDWKMPKKDGVQITREIRERIGGDIPIIILSAYDWSAIEQEALAAGVNEFIAKPLFKSRLIYVMKKVLLGQDDSRKNPDMVLLQEEQFTDKRVLLVDDNELNLEIAYEILTMSGFKVDQARDGREAVECLMDAEPGTYQVVLMDVQMPVMNGYEATRAVRQSGREDLRTLPIIAMTADAFSEDIKKAEESGMNGHIAKPVDINKMMEALKTWVE